MVRHYIIVSSSYTDGTRVALDITDERLLNNEIIAKTIDKIKKICGDDVPLSTHFIVTESDSWQSVEEYDPFFEEVKCLKTSDEFIKIIKQGRVLTGLDVASYILSKRKCTHLELEKLVYLAYADYLCDYSKRLFEDKIFAFTHGPVVDSVYQTYKRSGYQYIQPLEFGTDSDITAEVKELPAQSRILFAKDGAEKLHSIDLTIKKYGRYFVGTLVDITHRKNAPWSHVDSSKAYQVISDDLIKLYHYEESV